MRRVPFDCMPSPIPRQDRRDRFARYSLFDSNLPRFIGGSAPALSFSRPAQCSLTLRPAALPSRLRDPFHRRLQRLRCLRHCFGCYRAERSSSRAGLAPTVDQCLSRRTMKHALMDCFLRALPPLLRGRPLAHSRGFDWWHFQRRQQGNCEFEHSPQKNIGPRPYAWRMPTSHAAVVHGCIVWTSLSTVAISGYTYHSLDTGMV